MPGVALVNYSRNSPFPFPEFICWFFYAILGNFSPFRRLGGKEFVVLVLANNLGMGGKIDHTKYIFSMDKAFPNCVMTSYLSGKYF